AATVRDPLRPVRSRPDFPTRSLALRGLRPIRPGTGGGRSTSSLSQCSSAFSLVGRGLRADGRARSPTVAPSSAPRPVERNADAGRGHPDAIAGFGADKRVLEALLSGAMK